MTKHADISQVIAARNRVPIKLARTDTGKRLILKIEEHVDTIGELHEVIDGLEHSRFIWVLSACAAGFAIGVTATLIMML